VSDLEGKRILVVDDEIDILRLIESIFSGEGAQVFAASSGEQALQLLATQSPDLVILDIMMPHMDGFETCNLIKQRSTVPIIFLTALSQDDEIVRGLEGGAVDYITKPFSSKVLVARVRAALRQATLADLSETQPLYDDGYLRIDPAAHRVFVQGEAVKLSPLEYGLLMCLFEDAGRVVPYDEILERVWGEVYRDSINYVHVYVRYLRQKLEPDPNAPTYIHTERGAGYRFQVTGS
jgi:two-component system KDP operon response regulator KdpE